jgi:hypothetical protein
LLLATQSHRALRRRQEVAGTKCADRRLKAEGRGSITYAAWPRCELFRGALMPEPIKAGEEDLALVLRAKIASRPLGRLGGLMIQAPASPRPYRWPRCTSWRSPTPTRGLRRRPSEVRQRRTRPINQSYLDGRAAVRLARVLNETVR